MTIPDTAPKRTVSPLLAATLEFLTAAPAAVFGALVTATLSQVVLNAIVGTQGFQDIIRYLFGGLIGALAAAPLGTHVTGRMLGRPGSLRLAYVGSALGALSFFGAAPFASAAPAVWAAPPALIVIGAVVGYNVRRRKKDGAGARA